MARVTKLGAAVVREKDGTTFQNALNAVLESLDRRGYDVYDVQCSVDEWFTAFVVYGKRPKTVEEIRSKEGTDGE